jgi:hypothetical protein
MDMLTRDHQFLIVSLLSSRSHLHLKLAGEPFVVIIEQCDPFGASTAYADVSCLGAPYLLFEHNAADPAILQLCDSLGTDASLLSVNHNNDLDLL